MLRRGERSVTVAGSELESEVSAGIWERFQAAREQELQQGLIGSEDYI
jgi:hypothetical protein